MPIHNSRFTIHSGRRPWFGQFRAALGRCGTVGEIERLLRVKVQRWRGLVPVLADADGDVEGEPGSGSEDAEGEELEGQQQQQYLFHMPDLGFFTPRRVVLAVGRMRMLPSLRMDSFLRQGDTAKT